MANSNVILLPQVGKIANSFEAAIEAFMTHCKSRNLSRRTLEYYQTRLRVFSRWLAENYPGIAPTDVTEDILRRFIISEGERCGAAMAEHAHKSVKPLFAFLARDGVIQANPMARIPLPKTTPPVIKAFSVEQVDAVLETCKQDFLGVRDRAIILTLLDCALRASELCNLELDDVDWTEQTLTVREGKGGKSRIVPFSQTVRAALMAYTARRGQLETRALFVTTLATPLSRYHLRTIIKKRCEAAGISGLRCSPHDLRHTAALHFLRNGGDPLALQRLLGHADLTMTRRYCALTDNDLKEKHRQCSPADRLKAAKAKQGRRRLR